MGGGGKIQNSLASGGGKTVKHCPALYIKGKEIRQGAA